MENKCLHNRIVLEDVPSGEHHLECIMEAMKQNRRYHLENSSGAYVEVTELGAVLVKVCVPDREGVLTDVVLGFDNVKQYEENPFFFGVVVGRNCNRIGGAKFNLFGKEIRLAANENGNNLHSGPDGFETKMWKATEISQEKQSVTFTRVDRKSVV